MRKYCRICWNTSYWREPTGEASRLEVGKSYVRQNGFGHEEWLFNFSWLQPGPIGTSTKFKYGFLQPIGKYRDTLPASLAMALAARSSHASSCVEVGRKSARKAST